MFRLRPHDRQPDQGAFRSEAYVGVYRNEGYHFRGPHNKDCNILGSILGSPYLGKVSYAYRGLQVRVQVLRLGIGLDSEAGKVVKLVCC